MRPRTKPGLRVFLARREREEAAVRMPAKHAVGMPSASGAGTTAKLALEMRWQTPTSRRASRVPPEAIAGTTWSPAQRVPGISLAQGAGKTAHFVLTGSSQTIPKTCAPHARRAQLGKGS